MMGPETKEKVEARLRRVAGQVTGIRRMVEEDRYCVDILTQISAARAALGGIGRLLLESHVQTCVIETFESGDALDRAEKIEELVRIFEKSLRS